MKIKSVGILGCGLMGSGIAQVCAQSGLDTTVCEISREAFDKGVARIRGFMEEGVKRGKVKPEEIDSTISRIRGTARIEDLAACDIVIEAIIEKLDAKREAFAGLDRICRPETILATNTSSISVSKIAEATARADRCIGLHFMNPVPVMKLVEIVRPDAASEETFRTARDFVASLGKVPVTAKDTPGFIVNVLLVPYLCDAVRALERSLASAEDIDTAMKLGCGMPMGPLELIDYVGLDTILYIMDILHAEFASPWYDAPALLRRMVADGRTGKKSGRGFYSYPRKT